MDFKDSFEWSEELRESMKENCPNPGCHCGACEKPDIEDWQIEEALNGRR
jgi:hypothetical protein